MIFTTKAEYGVRLLIQLGLQGSGQPVSLKAVAEAENLPLAYLRADRRAAQEGRPRARPPAARTAATCSPARPRRSRWTQVVLALEGAIAPMDCFLDDRDGARAVLPRRRTTSTAPPSCCGRACRWASSARCSAPRWPSSSSSPARTAPTPAPRHPPRRSMADLEIKNLHVTAGGQADPQGRGPARPLRRVPRADGPERLRQVDARQRDHGPPEPRGDRGPDPLRRRGHHGGRSGRARPRRPVHGLPVPGRDPGRDRRQVPAHGHERPPRGARRAGDLAEGLPQDRRGRDGAHARSRASSPTATSTTASPAARRSAWRSSSSRCRSRRWPCSTRPTPASTSTRSTPSPPASTRSPRAPTWAC